MRSASGLTARSAAFSGIAVCNKIAEKQKAVKNRVMKTLVGTGRMHVHRNHRSIQLRHSIWGVSERFLCSVIDDTLVLDRPGFRNRRIRGIRRFLRQED